MKTFLKETSPFSQDLFFYQIKKKSPWRCESRLMFPNIRVSFCSVEQNKNVGVFISTNIYKYSGDCLILDINTRIKKNFWSSKSIKYPIWYWNILHDLKYPF